MDWGESTSAYSSRPGRHEIDRHGAEDSSFHGASPLNAIRLFSSLVSIVFAATACAQAGKLEVPAHGVIGVETAQLAPEFWVARLADPDRVIFDAGMIAAHNAELFRIDPSVHDLRALPSTLARSDVLGWIQSISARPAQTLHDIDGNALAPQTIDALIDDLALAAVPERSRALRPRGPSRRPAHLPDQSASLQRTQRHIVDRFQETALFPGMPVVIAHQSRDGLWWFVVSPALCCLGREETHRGRQRGAGLRLRAQKALPHRHGRHGDDGRGPGPAGAFESAHGHGRARAGARTVAARATGQRAASVCLARHRIATAQRGRLAQTDGRAAAEERRFTGRLPAAHARKYPAPGVQVPRRALRLGHGNVARDCSGFVSDVYRSMGVEMPRNTRDQSISPALAHRTFGTTDDRAARLAAARRSRSATSYTFRVT